MLESRRQQERDTIAFIAYIESTFNMDDELTRKLVYQMFPELR